MDKQIGFNTNNNLSSLPDGGEIVDGDKVVVFGSACDGFVLKTLPADTTVTYTYDLTNPSNDGDGIIEYTVTGSDGSAQLITIDTGTHIPDTDTWVDFGVNADGSITLTSANGATTATTMVDTNTDIYSTQPAPVGADGILTIPRVDQDGNSVIPLVVDLTALISSPHPTVTDGNVEDTVAVVVDGSGNVTVNGSTVTQNTVGGVTTTTMVTPAGTFAWNTMVDTTDTSISTDNTITISTSQNGDGSQTEDFSVNVCSKDIEAQQFDVLTGNVNFNRTQITASNYIVYDTFDIAIANPSDCPVDFLILGTQHVAIGRSQADSGTNVGVEHYTTAGGMGALSHHLATDTILDVFNAIRRITVPAGGLTIPITLYLYPDMTTDDDQQAVGIRFQMAAIPFKSFGGFK